VAKVRVIIPIPFASGSTKTENIFIFFDGARPPEADSIVPIPIYLRDRFYRDSLRMTAWVSGSRWPRAEIATSSFPEVKRREGLLAMTEGVIFYY
jgi:hypothetical protein